MGPGLTPQPYHHLPDWASNLMQLAVPRAGSERSAASGTVPAHALPQADGRKPDQLTSGSCFAATGQSGVGRPRGPTRCRFRVDSNSRLSFAPGSRRAERRRERSAPHPGIR